MPRVDPRVLRGAQESRECRYARHQSLLKIDQECMANDIEPFVKQLVAKATEFFADGNEVFARAGDGIGIYVCKCETEHQAQIVAGTLDRLRLWKDYVVNSDHKIG